MKYGYARVSTDDQNPALQLAALKKAGCQTVFKDEGISGATTKRPACSLPEEARTRRHADSLEARPAWPEPARPDNRARRSPPRRVKFHSLTDAIGDPHGSRYVANDRRSGRLCAERTRAGVKAAKRRGVKFWPALTPEQIDHARKPANTKPTS